MRVFRPSYSLGSKIGNPSSCVGGTDGKLLKKIGVWMERSNGENYL